MSHPLSALLQQASCVGVEHDQGSGLFDVEGNACVEFSSGVGVTGTGHCQLRVVVAAQGLALQRVAA